MSITILEARAQWIQHMQAKGRKDRTIYNSIQPVTHLHRACGNIQIASIRPQHVDKMFHGQTWSPRTRNLYLGNLALFFKFCRRMGWMPKDYDPTEGWDPVRVPREQHLQVPPERFGDLLDAARHPRDRAFIALGLFTFGRSSEIITLRVADLDFSRNTVAIFRHKTSQSDILPMVAELKPEMLNWLDWYDKAVGGLQSHYHLVPALAQAPMVYNPSTRLLEPSEAIQKPVPTKPMSHPYEAVQYALNVLGYDVKKAGGHTLRRSGALALFQATRDSGYDGALRLVSSMLGHSDTKMTEVYLGIGIERLQRNEKLAGQPMLPDLIQPLPVTNLKAV